MSSPEQNPRTAATPGDAPRVAAHRGSLRAALARLMGNAAEAPSRIAITGAPEALTALAPGSPYIVYARPGSAESDALLWETARAARTRHVTLALSRARAQAAHAARARGFAIGASAPGWPRNLNVLAMPVPDRVTVASSGEQAGAGEAAPMLARLVGALRALRRFGIRSNGLYLIEGAERWFNWDDSDALAQEARLLAEFCATRRIALVLLMDPEKGGAAARNADATARAQPVQSDDRPGIRDLHGVCAGVAQLHVAMGEPVWRVQFWRAGGALVTGEVCALRYTEQGALTVAPETAGASGSRSAALLAHDEERIVATRAVVANETWVPPGWEIVDDHEALLAACAGAQAATVVLDYTNSEGLEALCATVHALRRECGRALKIVVVERREALRHQYELLLSSLGANLLLGRDLPFSRMQSLLRSLQGQVDARPIAPDYRGALAAALTDAVRGYLGVGPFCERVHAVLERGAQLRLPHVLARMTLLPGVAHAEALRQCAPRRAGDVFTADASHLYVFLFACRLPDAETALARIFKAPVGRLSDRVVYLAEDAIAREVDALAETNRRSPLADYRDLFPREAVAPTVSTVPALDRDEPIGTASTHVAAGAPTRAPTEPASGAARQLQAMETMLADLQREAARADVDAEARDGAVVRRRPPARRADPCPMPLRVLEEKK